MVLKESSLVIGLFILIDYGNQRLGSCYAGEPLELQQRPYYAGRIWQ